ncbi:M3 family metallopeptidase [Parapusillimonas granuli]|uniref:oligopeptidase A n=1 Tax=Parapusillimonas granuli TaxID=380911 RepID=A0A853G6C1_9BURK|nr:M3 family metallopeptidase [Parapusillimonas granuli]MBB5214109.1 oligopeptidase A [Parapusillimonas granuli]MEB2401620.1 M3 family metallopeptidase [Alcaligenaceae bacterium]NYT50530.1 M3 family metallopeptidase [Parapusillimonas granuli]
MTQNPLLAPIGALIDYSSISPSHIEPAIKALIQEARAAVERAADPALPATWADIVEPLDDAGERLWRSWSVAGHLNAVVNTPELRAAYNQCLPLVTEFSTWSGLHTGLYAQYKRLRASDAFQGLTAARRRIIELALRDFRLSGVELQGADRERYAEISDQQAQAAQKFSENVLDSVDGWSLYVDAASRLDGLPPDVVEAARAAAQGEGREGWKLVLKMPCYLPVMQYARDRSLRQEMYRAYATIASEHGDPRLDNSPLIERLLALRAEEAALLGYASYAELRLETRMADDAGQVLDFLRELARKAKPHALRDLDELREFARERLNLPELEPWDIAFASERLREERYDYSEDEVKQYFTEPQVLRGLFRVMEKLFGIGLRACDAPTWHPDAKAYEVLSGSGEPLGILYLDLYARQGKQGGAWVDGERNRRKRHGAVHAPVVYLTCNFSKGQNGKPALLTHDDVITLFHESGHALHALLSEVDDLGAAAFASVEWDAIELPSQFMENFCWEWGVVTSLTAHVEHGGALPRALYDKLRAAKNFQSGMQMLRQIEFSLFDMDIHHQAHGLSIQQVLDTLDEVRKEVAVLFPPSWHRFPHNFSHLFAGGYGAGYYSYKWAEVLSADAYAAFEESATAPGAAALGASSDTLDPATGRRFLKEILAVGGSRPAGESFAAFRGRPPSIDALLRHSGLASAEAER